MRNINGVGVWPVAFTGAARWAGPVCKQGHVVGFHTNWKPFRTFPIDMAAFAINIRKLLVDRPLARFDPDVKPGFLETSFLEQITSVEELEPKADMCMKVRWGMEGNLSGAGLGWCATVLSIRVHRL